jgi:hypothetical protein
MLNFEKYKGSYGQTASHVDVFQKQLREVRESGRSQEWISKQVHRLQEDVRGKITEGIARRQSLILEQNQQLLNSYKMADNFPARSYFLQEANLLSNGKNGKELIQLYESIAVRGTLPLEAKQAYETVIKSKIDSEFAPDFDAVRRKYMTQEELSRETAKQQLQKLPEFLPVVDAVVEDKIQAALEGRDLDKIPGGKLSIDQALGAAIERIQSIA